MAGQVHGRRPRRLDAHDPAVRLQLLHRKGDAADETAAPDGHHDLLHVRQLLQDLQADGALAGDHQRVVERVGEGVALLLRQPLRLRRRVVIDAGHQHHLCAVATGGLHLADGRPGGHADHRLDPQPGCGQGNALGVVPRRAGDDAPGRLLRRQAADLVVGAPELEGPGQLQVFRLDVHVLPKFRGPVQRCPPGDAPQGLLGLPDHIQSQHGLPSHVFLMLHYIGVPGRIQCTTPPMFFIQ